MLDHLRAEDAVERCLGQILQVPEEIRDLSIEPLMPAHRDALLAEVDALRRDARGAHHFEELATSASNVEHVLQSREVRQVHLLSCFDVLFGAAESLRESPVVKR